MNLYSRNPLIVVARVILLLLISCSPSLGSENTHGGRVRSGNLPPYLQGVQDNDVTAKVYAQMLKARARYLAAYEPELLQVTGSTDDRQLPESSQAAASGQSRSYPQGAESWPGGVPFTNHAAPYVSASAPSGEYSAPPVTSTASAGGFSPEATREAQRKAWNEYQEAEAESKRRTVVPYQVAPQAEAAQGKTEYVNGYFRQDGQYVKPYYRRPGEY